MTQKSMIAKEVTSYSRYIIYKWGIIGGVIGAIFGFLLGPSVLTILGINLVYKTNAPYVAIAGALLGIFISMFIIWLKLLIPKNKVQKDNSYLHKAKIELRQEELELSKHRVKTGEVKIHKEILKEEKNISVPIIREELVIENREISEESKNNASGGIKTIRIPIREEGIKVSKYPITLEDVSIFKQQIQDIQHIEETLKREELHVKTKGDVNVLEKKLKKE